MPVGTVAVSESALLRLFLNQCLSGQVQLKLGRSQPVTNPEGAMRCDHVDHHNAIKMISVQGEFNPYDWTEMRFPFSRASTPSTPTPSTPNYSPQTSNPRPWTPNSKPKRMHCKEYVRGAKSVLVRLLGNAAWSMGASEFHVNSGVY